MLKIRAAFVDYRPLRGLQPLNGTLGRDTAIICRPGFVGLALACSR